MSGIVANIELYIMLFCVHNSPRNGDGTVPIVIPVMVQQTQYDLRDPRLMVGIIYDIIVLAKNSFGIGPPSNSITFGLEEGEPQIYNDLHKTNV